MPWYVKAALAGAAAALIAELVAEMVEESETLIPYTGVLTGAASGIAYVAAAKWAGGV